MYKARKVLWEVHREHADTEYKAYMSAKEKWVRLYFLHPIRVIDC